MRRRQVSPRHVSEAWPNPATASATPRQPAPAKSAAIAQAKAKAVDCAQVKCLALTFDDGPGKYAGTLLDTLKKYNAKATFFLEGQYSRRQFTFSGSGSEYTDPIRGTLILDQSRANARFWSPTFCGVCGDEGHAASSAVAHARATLRKCSHAAIPTPGPWPAPGWSMRETRAWAALLHCCIAAKAFRRTCLKGLAK
jgi:hypothetical protein